MRFPSFFAGLTVVALGVFAPTTGQAQTALLSQTFDGYTVGANVPAGTAQTFGTVTGAFAVSNTNAATLFPAASTGSSVAGGDAGTNYGIFGSVASERARTNTLTGLNGVTFSTYFDINLPSTGTGGALLSIVNSSATDINASTGTFAAFTLANTGAVTAAGTGGALSGGTAVISLNTQVVLSLVVNDTAAAVPYTSAGFSNTLPAFTADIYASSATGTTYVGRLTSTTGTNATTNIPQQIGLANFGGTAPMLRINELECRNRPGGCHGAGAFGVRDDGPGHVGTCPHGATGTGWPEFGLISSRYSRGLVCLLETGCFSSPTKGSFRSGF